MPTKIEWTHGEGYTGETWNMIGGCTKVSEGCRECYALRNSWRIMGNPNHPARYDGVCGVGRNGLGWTGKINLDYDALEKPLRWRKSRMVFVASMSDLFHEAVPFDFVRNVWNVMETANNHVFQVLTKRADRMLQFLTDQRFAVRGYMEPLPNVWCGITVENQYRADERREYLRQCPAAVRFVSYEPSLGPVNWEGWEFVDQIIGGGESGAGARPSHPDWHRATRDFCQKNDIAYFFKQWGEYAPADAISGNDHLVASTSHRWGVIDIEGKYWPLTTPWTSENGTTEVVMYRVGKHAAGRILDGRTWDEFPEVD